MAFKVENCTDGDAECIVDRLVEYNLSQVPPEQITLFDTLDKKITDDNGRIIAGCIARMYRWNVAYVDTLWVDSEYRGKGLGAKLIAKIEKTAKTKGCYLIHLDTFDFQAKSFTKNMVSRYSVF